MKKKSVSAKNKVSEKGSEDTKYGYVWKMLFGIFLSWVGFYFGNNFRNTVFAPSSIEIPSKCQNVTCSSDYKNYPIFDGCTPKINCRRCVKDGLVTQEEIVSLMRLLQNGMKHGGSSGGASILDLHTGALSKGQQFINIYKSLESTELSETFPNYDMQVYRKVKNKILAAIANEFGLDPKKLHLTNPTFFSRMTTTPAKTQHDEYWHSHIDKIQYGSFDYTSLLYLADYGSDFKGGQFVFDKTTNSDKEVIIEPRNGRVSFFTSGSENPHHVQKVIEGVRYAVTISFTCDPSKAITDPLV
ncbi:2-oxoglutarate and iron-dependent oxygenase domain-containing protein 3-like [Ciona intestinalis]